MIVNALVVLTARARPGRAGPGAPAGKARRGFFPHAITKRYGGSAGYAGPGSCDGLLLVVLDDLGRADARFVGILAEFAQRAAPAKQIPALIELDLDLLKTTPLVVGKLGLLAEQTVLLPHQLLDVLPNRPIAVFGLHGSLLGADPRCGGPLTPNRLTGLTRALHTSSTIPRLRRPQSPSPCFRRATYLIAASADNHGRVAARSGPASGPWPGGACKPLPLLSVLWDVTQIMRVLASPAYNAPQGHEAPHRPR